METNIRALRKARNLTQEQLAAKIGATKGMVGHWERGFTSISLEHACAIADVLECTLDELAGRSFPPDGGRHDRRQESMNRDYSGLSEDDKSAVAAMVSAFAVSRRSSSFQGDSAQGVA